MLACVLLLWGCKQRKEEAARSREAPSETGESEAESETSSCDPAHLALDPPPVELAEGRAVPIDLLAVSSTITLDASASADEAPAQPGRARSLVRFRTGPSAGWPIVDLRQRVSELRLDGELVELKRWGFERLSPGSTDTHRVLALELEPCTRHELEIVHAIATPDAHGAKAPRVEDGRVVWDVRFSDLSGGRYLESWAPAGLIHDRFELEIRLGLEGAQVEHRLATNGALEPLGDQRWRVSWSEILPEAPFWALLPVDRYLAREGTHELQSGQSIPYSIHAELALGEAELDRLAQLLLDQLDELAARLGPYPHPRLTAVLGRRVHSMEYAGALTSDEDSLRHELTHMWWARDVYPLRPGDGWIDEAWTEFVVEPDKPVKLDWEHAPVLMLEPSPYARVTSSQSYSRGQALLVLIADGEREELEQAMASYRELVAADSGLFSTAGLERHLHCTLGRRPEIRRAFHRFVWGREGPPEPAPKSWCEG